jgi:hypothetical protein
LLYNVDWLDLVSMQLWEIKTRRKCIYFLRPEGENINDSMFHPISNQVYTQVLWESWSNQVRWATWTKTY